MRTVYLVGTNHDYQWPQTGARGEETERFRALVADACRQNGVKALAEEMSLDALAVHGASESICKQVADALHMAHRYCDPSCEQQKARGIVEEDTIWLSGKFANRDEREIEAEMRASSAMRESCWLEQLLDLDTWPALFVCGANHTEPFRALLAANDIAVNVLFVKWTPD